MMVIMMMSNQIKKIYIGTHKMMWRGNHKNKNHKVKQKESLFEFIFDKLIINVEQFVQVCRAFKKKYFDNPTRKYVYIRN
jgi:hypothetical protein